MIQSSEYLNSPESPQIEFAHAIDELKEQLDTLTPFARNILNPFTNIRELEEFSQTIEQGAGAEVVFGNMNKAGSGERIQAEFIAQFLKEYFPQLLISYDRPISQSNRKTVEVALFDYYEKKYKPSTFMTMFSLPKNVIGFSMTQAKIIHSNRPELATVEKLKHSLSALTRELSGYQANSENTPLIIGHGSPDYLQNIPFSFRRMYPTTEFINSYYHPKTGIAQKLRNLLLPQPSTPVKSQDRHEGRITLPRHFILRTLYTAADYPFIRDDKNKIEGVAAGVAPVITESIQFLEKTVNPNYILDKLLWERGYILTAQEFIQKGRKISQLTRPELSEAELTEIYNQFLSSPERLENEPTLKESMSAVIAALKS